MERPEHDPDLVAQAYARYREILFVDRLAVAVYGVGALVILLVPLAFVLGRVH